MSSALQKYKRRRERAGCIGRQKQMDLYVLEANLVYIVSPKLSQGLQSETLSPNKQTNKQTQTNRICTHLQTQVIFYSKVRALFDGKESRARTIDLGA